MKPTIGRIVIYNHPGSLDWTFPPSQSPAIIQRVIVEHPNFQTDEICFLWVFGPQGIFYITCAKGDGPCQWNWPKRETEG